MNQTNTTRSIFTLSKIMLSLYCRKSATACPQTCNECSQTTAQWYDLWRLGNRKFPKHSHYPALEKQVHAKQVMRYRFLSHTNYNQDQKYSTWRQKRVCDVLPSCLLVRKVEKNPWLQYCQHICCESDPTPSLVTQNQTLGCRQISLTVTSIAASSNVSGHCF
jgi:hypothetical protein